MKRKRKKRKIGSSLLFLFAACLWMPPGAAFAPEKNRPAEPFGLIGVTVFREPGFALPGSEVVLTQGPGDGAKTARRKGLKGATDSRGEYVFRVPPAPSHYLIRASHKGFLPQEKQVDAAGEGRIEVTFRLAAESK